MLENILNLVTEKCFITGKDGALRTALGGDLIEVALGEDSVDEFNAVLRDDTSAIGLAGIEVIAAMNKVRDFVEGEEFTPDNQLHALALLLEESSKKLLLAQEIVAWLNKRRDEEAAAG